MRNAGLDSSVVTGSCGVVCEQPYCFFLPSMRLVLYCVIGLIPFITAANSESFFFKHLAGFRLDWELEGFSYFDPEGTWGGEDIAGKITVDAITDGSVNDNATADYWALTDNSLSKLLVWGDLASAQSVTSGNTFTLTAVDVEFPDPA